MFGELPKLFDRNFVVGFFLPVGLFIVVSAILFNQFVFHVTLSTVLAFDFLITTTIFGLLGWVGGIVLMAVNRDLYRFMEGYGTYNPLKLFGWFEKTRYRRILKEKDDLDKELQECKDAQKEFPVKSRIKRRKIVSRLAVEFPDQEEFLLPTSFGNSLRSFETFPRAMYGLDPIPAWGRLLAVVPKEYIELVDSVKANVDLWVNLGVVFVLLQTEYVALVYITRHQLNWWIVVLWVVLGTLAPLRATSSAREWGEFVKAAFDVFAPKLRETLGIEKPATREAEFAQWQRYSQALIYRLRKELPELKK